MGDMLLEKVRDELWPDLSAYNRLVPSIDMNIEVNGDNLLVQAWNVDTGRETSFTISRDDISDPRRYMQEFGPRCLLLILSLMEATVVSGTEGTPRPEVTLEPTPQ